MVNNKRLAAFHDHLHDYQTTYSKTYSFMHVSFKIFCQKHDEEKVVITDLNTF